MKKKKWIERQQAILDAARAAGRGLTAEEQSEFDELQRKIETEPAEQPGDLSGSRSQESTPPAAGLTPDCADGAVRAVAEERQRNSDIMALCRQVDMDPTEYIRNGATVDAVRTAAIEHLVTHGAPVTARARDNGNDDFRSAACDAMLMQCGVELAQPAEGAEELRGMSVRDILIESIARSGEGTVTELLRQSRASLWDQAVRQFMSPTAAFPAILDDAIKKSIVQQYSLVPCTFEEWTSRGTLPDFKNTKDHNYVLGGGDFYKISEGGELKHSTLQTDLLPTRKLDSYGTQFTMTREAFINDDIGFLSAMPAQYASRAKRKINRQVYEILFENAAVFDGAALFDDAHKNLIAEGSAPSIAALERMILMMGMQTDQFGESIMVEPATIIVPMGYGMRVNQILGTAEIDVEGIGSHTVNVLNTQYKNRLRVVQEGTLNVLAKNAACPWFMAADPRLVKSIQVDYLNGVTAPSFRRSEKAGYLGYIWDIWLDWGVSVIDFRGILRNNGVKLGQ
ncbi:MAG: hypothetical protein HFH26_12555 [Clostridiaceae bacterium]|nr:hypothetical protein [Clostridiaceae bacterium]